MQEDDYEIEPLKMNGFDDCVLGMCEQFGRPPVLAYDKQKILEQLQRVDSMTADEALDFFEYNQLGAWHGARTPVFVDTTARPEGWDE